MNCTSLFSSPLERNLYGVVFMCIIVGLVILVAGAVIAYARFRKVTLSGSTSHRQGDGIAHWSSIKSFKSDIENGILAFKEVEKESE